MAIRIIEGVIGSGKTYYAVRHVAMTYFNFDSELQVYKPKDENFVLYSNIERLGLSKPLDPVIDENGGLSKFFNIDFQKDFIKDRKVVYIIDEAQSPKYFPRKYYDPKVFFFFQYHRHIGVDIYLITQDVDSLAKELRELAEYHIRSVRRTYSMFGEFNYHFICGNDVWKKQVLKPQNNIFSLYRSMDSGEVEKLKSAPRRYAFIFLLLVFLSVFIFYYGFIPQFTNAAHKIGSVPISVPLKSSVKEVQEKKAVQAVQPVSVSEVPAETANPSSSFLEVTITGKISVSDTNIFLIIFEDTEGREFKLNAFELDKLCKCNSFAKLNTGDSILIFCLFICSSRFSLKFWRGFKVFFKEDKTSFASFMGRVILIV